MISGEPDTLKGVSPVRWGEVGALWQQSPGLLPNHDTLANFRRTFLPEIKELFVQVLLQAQQAGVLKLGTISLDGSKVHADASKRQAVSYKRLRELETQLRTEVEELFAPPRTEWAARGARWAGSEQRRSRGGRIA